MCDRTYRPIQNKSDPMFSHQTIHPINGKFSKNQIVANNRERKKKRESERVRERERERERDGV